MRRVNIGFAQKGQRLDFWRFSLVKLNLKGQAPLLPNSSCQDHEPSLRPGLLSPRVGKYCGGQHLLTSINWALRSSGIWLSAWRRGSPSSSPVYPLQLACTAFVTVVLVVMRALARPVCEVTWELTRPSDHLESEGWKSLTALGHRATGSSASALPDSVEKSQRTRYGCGVACKINTLDRVSDGDCIAQSCQACE